jgi:carbonic anhydrase/acetyltransferase-like protein (isoleucine patch superfamily)
MDIDRILQRLDRFLGAKPVIADHVFVAPNAVILGAVSIGSRSSVWFQSVIRADINEIQIGSETNIQDGSILAKGIKPEREEDFLTTDFADYTD